LAGVTVIVSVKTVAVVGVPLPVEYVSVALPTLPSSVIRLVIHTASLAVGDTGDCSVPVIVGS
jgi:hypothetical protein